MTPKDRFIRLSWYLLECKYIYYYHANDYKGISDDQYDLLEEEYKSLAQNLGLEPSVTNMVGFDQSRPSCRLVMERVNKTKKLTSALLSDTLE